MTGITEVASCRYDVTKRTTMIFNNESTVVDDPAKDERLAMAALPQM